MQFQADLLGIPVVRPEVIETTALGAAGLAGIGVGLFRDPSAMNGLWRPARRFHPTMDRDRALESMDRWSRAVRQATAP